LGTCGRRTFEFLNVLTTTDTVLAVHQTSRRPCLPPIPMTLTCKTDKAWCKAY
jgi:hypothetical protein